MPGSQIRVMARCASPQFSRRPLGVMTIPNSLRRQFGWEVGVGGLANGHATTLDRSQSSVALGLSLGTFDGPHKVSHKEEGPTSREMKGVQVDRLT